MKKRIVGLILAFLLILTLLPVTVSASNAINSFSMTNNKKENISFMLEDGQLVVKSLPDNAAYKSVFIDIVGVNGQLQIERVLERKADGSVAIPLSCLNTGDYYVELFFYAGNDLYKSYIFGDELRFHWSEGTSSFISSPTYEHNKKTYEAGRSDNAALAHYLSPEPAIQSSNNEIVKLANDITNGITTDYDKALAIHEWVCTNIWYDWDTLKSDRQISSDAVGVMKRQRAKCSGYANLMAALLRAVEIPTKSVKGYGRINPGGWTLNQISGKDEPNHIWNEAYIDGRWVIIDATWDCGNDYKGGKKDTSDGLYFSRYFDPTIEAFSIDHRIEPYSESAIPRYGTTSSWVSRQANIAITSWFIQ